MGLREEAELKIYAQEHMLQNIAEKSTRSLLQNFKSIEAELKIEERKLKIGGTEERKLKNEADHKIGGAELILFFKIRGAEIGGAEKRRS